MFSSFFLKWKPGNKYYIPMEEIPIHKLEGPHSFLHPGYMGTDIYLPGKQFLAAEGLTVCSCAHAFYAALMSSSSRAYDVAISTSVALAKDKAEFYGPRKDWMALSTGLMEDVIYQRFNGSFKDKRLLMDMTYKKPILADISGSITWGVIKTSYGYKGLNLIGKGLMRYRSWLIVTSDRERGSFSTELI